jgi:hypothetical protein
MPPGPAADRVRGVERMWACGEDLWARRFLGGEGKILRDRDWRGIRDEFEGIWGRVGIA